MSYYDSAAVESYVSEYSVSVADVAPAVAYSVAGKSVAGGDD